MTTAVLGSCCRFFRQPSAAVAFFMLALYATGKYEYGILALERATECFWECSGRSARYDRLVRRVTRITREHGDTKRALMYHSRMLQAAKKINNVNEFVYLAKEISRMLKEEASGCLCVWVCLGACPTCLSLPPLLSRTVVIRYMHLLFLGGDGGRPFPILWSGVK